MTLSAGTRLGPYEVLALIGAGGMGEVYRARDTRLGRMVAVKVLPETLARDFERLARFESEARAASALNHPNIVTIYDVGRQGETAWIAMELVEGPTLRELLVDGLLPRRRAVAIGVQLAQGLARAHEAGIVHRDFKPENVVVTGDGRAKILDFGLAAMAAPRFGAASEAPTAALKTAPGAVMGTVGYMAPEQVRGQPADPRTDLFALGAVLFEMLSGRRAFPGASAADVTSAILKEDPDLSAIPDPGLERIVRHCLEKDPEQRFQSGRDLGFALESLSSGAVSQDPAGVAPARSRRRSARLAVPLAAAAIFALGWLLRPLLISDAGVQSFSRAVRLTSGPARDFAAVLSPDGKWVLYLSNARGPVDVWVKFLAGGEAANLTAGSGLEIQSRTDIGGPDISPDGTFLVVDAAPLRGGKGELALGYESWAIPAPLGGAPRKFLPGGHAVRFSPDGKRIVFVGAGGSLGDSLFLADADGGNRKEILKRRGGLHAHWPAWSADGRYVYFIYGIASGNSEPSEIYRVLATGGAPEPVVRTSRRAVYPVPMPDGRGLLYAANPDTADLALWWRPLSGGEPRRVTVGVGNYAEPRISRDGRSLVATLLEQRQSLAVVPITFDSAVSARALGDGYSGDFDPTIPAPSRSIVFSSSRSGNRNLWACAPDGSSPRPLTTGNAIDERPAASPDGRQIAFVSDRGGHRGIWVVPSEGGAPRRIAGAEALDTLTWTADGAVLVYAAPKGGAPGLFRVSVADGRISHLGTPGPAHSPAISPSGDRIAYLEPHEGGSTRLRFLDAAGRPVAPGLPDDGPQISNGVLAWAPNGKRLAAMAVPGSGETVIWVVEPGGSPAVRRLITLPSGTRGRGLAWGPESSSLLLGQNDLSSDVVLFSRRP